MLAGFALGLVVSGIGEPRRLARQLFGITEGFFGPLFFVWLGVPVAAATLGTEQQLLAPGESSALMLGALVTIASTSIAGLVAARRQSASRSSSG